MTSAKEAKLQITKALLMKGTTETSIDTRIAKGNVRLVMMCTCPEEGTTVGDQSVTGKAKEMEIGEEIATMAAETTAHGRVIQVAEAIATNGEDGGMTEIATDITSGIGTREVLMNIREQGTNG